MKKIFVSQPMNGKTKEEILFERRVAMEKIEQTFSFLTEEGYEIIDSYFEDYNPEKGCVPLKYLAKSLELLAEADVAVFVGDWPKYRGCKIEYDCAKAYNLTIIDTGTSVVDKQEKVEALKQEIYLLEKEIQNEHNRLFVSGNYIVFKTLY